jgi:diketogulonate reductase-like aldo/keto reductase
MYSRLSNGVMMPILGLGTFLISNEEVKDKVLDAFKIGYRHIDTAQRYGNEEGIGQALKETTIPRSELFITSKQIYHMPFEEAKQAFFDSLKKLNTDYIDLFLIHWPNHDHNINIETWKFFEWLYQNHYVKAIGVSNFTIEHIKALLEHATIIPHVNQVELHPGLQQRPLRAFHDTLGIKTISYGPFMRGSILEAPFYEVLSIIASTYNITIHQLVLAWGIQEGVMMIPKASSFDRLKQNFDALNIPLRQEDMETLSTLNRGKRVYTDPSNNPWGIFKSNI